MTIDLQFVRELLAMALMIAGLVFLGISAVGVLRLPDFYTRLHASGIGETMGLMLTFLGLCIYEGFNLTMVKLVIIFLLVFIFNPLGTHMLGQAAIKSNLKPRIKGDETSCK